MIIAYIIENINLQYHIIMNLIIYIVLKENYKNIYDNLNI